MYDSEKTTFNDIYIGNNWCHAKKCCPSYNNMYSEFGYKSTIGFDPVTGLGTPNVKNIINWLNKNTK